MNLLTILAILIVVCGVAWGYFRGLAKLLYKLLAFVLALVLAHFLMPVVANLIIGHTQIDEKVETAVETKIRMTVEQRVRAQMADQLKDLPTDQVEALIQEALNMDPDRNAQIEVLQSLQIPEFAKTALIENNYKEAKEEMGVDNFYAYVSTYVSRAVVNAIAYVVTWAAVLLVLWILFFVITLAVKLPIIHSIDKFGGMVVGFVNAVIIVWLILAVAQISTGNGFADFMNSQVEESVILKVLNSYNPFVGLASRLTQI